VGATPRASPGARDARPVAPEVLGHLQSPDRQALVGISPRSGSTAKRAELGPSIVSIGRLQVVELLVCER
jgi:hypothetical protein